MLTVRRYRIHIETLESQDVGQFSHKMPIGGKVLSVNVKDNYPTMCVLLDPKRREKQRSFLIAKSDCERKIDKYMEQLTFIDTFQFKDTENFVHILHLFETV